MQNDQEVSEQMERARYGGKDRIFVNVFFRIKEDCCCGKVLFLKHVFLLQTYTF